MSQYDKTCDLVVVGGGGSGMVAAVRAAQLSGKRVIVLEKSKQTGGGMLFASTMRTFGSKWQSERGLPDVTSAYLRKVMDNTYWRLDPELVGGAILATGTFFDWFCTLKGDKAGDKFRVGRYVFDGEDGPLGPQMGGPGGVTGSGRLFMDTMREQCDALGVEVLTQHRAVDFVMEDSRVAAVCAQGPDGPVTIGCRACVLATGSWINDDEHMARTFPEFLAAKPHMGPSAHMNPAYTGDGFPLARRAGAKLDPENDCLRLMGPMCMSRSGVMANMGNSPYTLMVNSLGKRFSCEPSQTRCGIFNSGLTLMEQPGGFAYIIFDRRNLNAAIQAKNSQPEEEVPGIFGLPPFPQTLDAALRDARQGAEKEPGKVFAADNIRELALQLEIDPDVLEATVARYNGYCERGFDAECFKDPAYLVPCSEGPFFAVRGTLGTDGAFGGVLINGRMQAYAENGGVIEGLYVTGDFASGRFLNMGGVKVQVLNDMSWALASGFLAGGFAAEYISP